jgi:disulfide bond formation protein DsbB
MLSIGPAFPHHFRAGALALRGDIAATLLAGTVSLALIAGALLFQYAWAYPPCEICHWQRWPHIASAVLGLGGGAMLALKVFPARAARTFAWLVVVALVIAGALGVYHAGIEYGWWEGPAACTGTGFTPGSGAGFDAFHFVRCDEAAWTFLGVSLAGYNAIISFVVAAVCFALLRRGR